MSAVMNFMAQLQKQMTNMMIAKAMEQDDNATLPLKGTYIRCINGGAEERKQFEGQIGLVLKTTAARLTYAVFADNDEMSLTMIDLKPPCFTVVDLNSVTTLHQNKLQVCCDTLAIATAKHLMPIPRKFTVSVAMPFKYGSLVKRNDSETIGVVFCVEDATDCIMWIDATAYYSKVPHASLRQATKADVERLSASTLRRLTTLAGFVAAKVMRSVFSTSATRDRDMGDFVAPMYATTTEKRATPDDQEASTSTKRRHVETSDTKTSESTEKVPTKKRNRYYADAKTPSE